MKNHIIIVFVIVISCAMVGSVFATLAQNKIPEKALSSTTNLEESETNFLYQVLLLNSITKESKVSQAQKNEVILETAKKTQQSIQKLCKKINKYSNVMGSEWVVKNYELCKISSSWNLKDIISFTPLLEKADQQVDNEIEKVLRDKSILTTVSFKELDKFVLVYDEQYLALSERFFEESLNPRDMFNPLLDAIIRNDAQQRGFTAKKFIDEKELTTSVAGWQLKKGVGEQYTKMQEEARQAGVSFELISAYRGFDSQKELFTAEMVKYGIQITKLTDSNYINSESFREKLDLVLNRVAPPGYSRHHTGLTIDLYQEGVYDFATTQAFQWLSKNNYANAKKFGFLPSYPILEVATAYGPNPESWEYFYVSTDLTYDK